MLNNAFLTSGVHDSKLNNENAFTNFFKINFQRSIIILKNAERKDSITLKYLGLYVKLKNHAPDKIIIYRFCFTFTGWAKKNWTIFESL